MLRLPARPLKKLKSLQKKNEKSFTNDGERGIIKEKNSISKSVTIPENCEHLLKAKTNFDNKDISEDILVEINNAIEKQKNKGNIFNFDEILVAKFNNDNKSVFITELETFGGKYTNRLYLNSDFFVGASLQTLNEMSETWYLNGWWKSKTLGDLVNHEIMHAKINSIISFEKIERLYDELKEDDRVVGFCRLVNNNPDEFLNEMYVALNNGENIEQKYIDVYNEYIKEFFEE